MAPCRIRAKALVWADWCQGLSFNHPISLFDPPAIISSSRPSGFHRPLRAATVKGGRRPSRSDLPLTVASTAACLLVGVRPFCDHGSFMVSVGSYDDTEGSSPSGASIAPQTCIRSIHEDRHHDAVMRIGSELRGGGPILNRGS